jgi:hypothetical protein
MWQAGADLGRADDLEARFADSNQLSFISVHLCDPTASFLA